MKCQLAELHRGGRLFGYGVVVGSLLLDDQVPTAVDTDAENLPIVTAIFHLSNEHSENQPRIDLGSPLTPSGLNVVTRTDKPLTAERTEGFRDTVREFLTKHDLPGGDAWTSL